MCPQHQASSSLIVDFPSVPRGRNAVSSENSMANSIKAEVSIPTKPSVHFTAYSSMHMIEMEGSIDERWYSSQAKGMNKQEPMKDARQMGKVLTFARQKGIAVPQDILARAVGLEHLTSFKKTRRVIEYRKHHVTQVLAKQHVCTPEELGDFSSASSEVARSRAGALAAAYWKMQS